MPIIFKGVNQGTNPMDLVATHQRLLIGAALRTTGPILELGCGWYSTPLLHEIAKIQQRYLVTLDDNDHWLQQFAARDWSDKYGFKDRYHQLIHVPYWEDAKLEPGDYDIVSPGWGLVFVDHGPPIERLYVARRMFNPTTPFREFKEPTVFVFHDTEESHPYGYDRLLKRFKYQWTDTCQKAHTTVASNRVDVTDWFRMLPPVVEPAKEVT
jgi:hypothetical protein